MDPLLGLMEDAVGLLLLLALIWVLLIITGVAPHGPLHLPPIG
jgi:predicted small lipoprotein YifL